MNLAQACLLIAYEIFLAVEGDAEPLPQGKRSTGLATRKEMEVMLVALEGGLTRIEFFKARAVESVMRTFRTLFSRAAPDQQEAGLVKALGFEINNYIDRLSRQGGEAEGKEGD